VKKLEKIKPLNGISFGKYRRSVGQKTNGLPARRHNPAAKEKGLRSCVVESPGSPLCLFGRDYPIVKGIVTLVVPHSMRSVPPAAEGSIEIVSCSTAAFVFPTFIGVRPISSWG
jgi:hypothetical protein